jgi:predicted lipoprotein
VTSTNPAAPLAASLAYSQPRNSSMNLTRRKILAFVLVAVLGGCKIVANADLKAAKSRSSDDFDATAYVDKIWTPKVIPEFKDKAIPIETLLQEVATDPDKAGQKHGHREGDGNPWTFLIKGEGRITAVDVESRHGIVSIEVQTASGPRKVDLQVGPVVFGTALRDALQFIKFGDFVNQIQYAQVSRVLNDRATKGVRGSIDLKDAAGKTIAFYAAAVLGSGDTINATPVIIEPPKGERT